MKVKDLMSTDVVSASPEMPLKQAAKLMVRHRISGLPVVDEDRRVVGVLSETDILYKERYRDAADDGLLGHVLHRRERHELESKLEARTVGQAMTSPAIAVEDHLSLAYAATQMADEKVNRLPVVDGGGRLLGIITRADVVRAFARPDEEIAEEIERLFADDFWMPVGAISVAVSEGDVVLRGRADTKENTDALLTAVGQIPGVVSIESYVS